MATERLKLWIGVVSGVLAILGTVLGTAYRAGQDAALLRAEIMLIQENVGRADIRFEELNREVARAVRIGCLALELPEAVC